MRTILMDIVKVFFLFVAFTLLFYYGLRVMHAEYEHFHRYAPPKGPAVKVYSEEHSFFERIHLFFRLGE